MDKKAKREYDRRRYQRLKAERESAKPPSIIDEMTEVQAAYVAGLLDGEGSFGIAYLRKMNRYIPQISCSMTDKDPIVYLAQLGGVSYFPVKRKRPLPNSKPQWQVKISGKRAIALCRRIRPYLLVKGPHADLFFEFEKTYIVQAGAGHCVPQEILDLRADIKKRIHRLNGGKNQKYHIEN